MLLFYIYICMCVCVCVCVYVCGRLPLPIPITHTHTYICASLVKEMANHSSILAWEIPEQRSLAGYSSLGHKELDTTYQLNHYTHTHTHTHAYRASLVAQW